MPSKKKTNKQSKLKRTLNALNPRSLKGGILLFAIVFALGGGGYFLYKSHADPLSAQLKSSSKPIYTLTIGPGSMQTYECCGGTAKIFHDPQLSSKAGANATYNLVTPAGSNDAYAGVYLSQNDSNVAYIVNHYKGHTTQTCVYARGANITGVNHTLDIEGVGYYSPKYSDFHGYTNIGGSYGTWCTNGGIVPSSTSQLNFGLSAEINRSYPSNENIVVASITVYVW